jgi:hypothetical protein
MDRRRWLVSLFIVLALVGCVQGSPGQAGVQRAPTSPQNDQNTPEHGGGNGGGGGSM